MKWERLVTEQVPEEQAYGEQAGISPEVAQQQLGDKMGLTLDQISTERVTGSMPVAGNLQPYGLLHGGANAVLAETLGSILAACNAGPEHVTPGLELSCTHHRAVTNGSVSGVATPVHIGRSTITSEIVITDESGKRSCTARLTCVVRHAPRSE